MLKNPFQLNLQWKIWLLTAVVIMGLALSTSMTVNYLIKTILSPIVLDELRIKQNLIQDDLNRKTDDLYRLARELAQTPRLKGSLSPDADPDALPKVANELLSLLPCDMMVITGGDSNDILYSYGKGAPPETFEYAGGMFSLERARNGESGTDVWGLGSKTYLVVTVPVSSLSGVIGTLSLGYELTNPRLVLSLQDRYKVSVAFLANDHILSSSLGTQVQNEFSKLLDKNPIEQQKGIVERKLNRTSPEIVTLGGEKYLMIPSILFPGSSGELDTVDFLSLEQFLKFPHEVQWALIIVSSVLALFALIFSYYITRSIMAPREHLVKTMSDITHSGDLAHRIDTRSRDPEMKSLTESFNRMVESLEQLQREKEDSYTSAIRAVMVALDARDSETYGHSERVVRYTMAIAKQMNITDLDLQSIRWGALLHDVGKIGIADAILRKPGPLTQEERQVMQEHPIKGFKMLEGIKFLDKAVPLVLEHHEKVDGKGYPNGLQGESIFLGARIFAVADVYDALTSTRPYRKPISYEEAVEEIKKGRGTHFDPKVVDAFLQIPKEDWLKLREG